MSDSAKDSQELDLIRSIGHDPRAMYRLYREHALGLYRFALALTGEPQAAEDAVQESMIAAWRDPSAFDGRSRVSTWLLGICRHKVLDALRRANRARNIEKRAASKMTSMISESQLPGRGGASPDVSARIEFWEAFGRLPLNQREVLLLVFHFGLSQDEASSVLGIPVGAVRSRVYRARTRLAALLENGTGNLPGEELLG